MQAKQRERETALQLDRTRLEEAHAARVKTLAAEKADLQRSHEEYEHQLREENERAWVRFF